MIEEQLLREARLQTAILKAGFRDKIDALANELRTDPVSSGIVDYLGQNDNTRSGTLKEAVTKALPKDADASPRTITRRLADLENKGVIERLGQGANTEYRLTGLIG